MRLHSILLFLLVIYLASCSQRIVEPDYSSWPSIRHEFLKVMRDTSVTWQQVEEISKLAADSLKVLSANPNDLDKRIQAQKWDYVAYELLNEKFDKMIEAGKDVKAEEVIELQSLIHASTTNWFYSREDGPFHFWRDHYYISYKETENPQEGFFHIIVNLNTEDDIAPGVHIFFPDSAEDSPYVVFCKTVDDADPDNIRDEDIIYLDDYIPKGAMEEEYEDYPMYASLGDEFLDQLFHNAAMLIGFFSETSPDGEPGQWEIAYINLQPFQDLVSEVAERDSMETEQKQDDNSFEAYADSVARITGIPWESPYFYDPSWGVTISDTRDTLSYYPREDKATGYSIPSTIKVIDARAFQCNRNLESIVIPKSVKEIGMGAFLWSKKLRSVVINGPVDSLRWRTFDDCPELVSVDLPSTLSFIDGLVFSHCENLREVIVRNPVPPVIDFIDEDENPDDYDPEWAFNAVPLNECALYVPREAVASYEKAPGWRLFGKIVPL